MASIVQICNMALGNIGISQTIASLDEKSKEAATCKRYYEQARDELLRDLDWPFATRYVTLALVAEAPNSAWGYSYRYPQDCEKVRRVLPTDIYITDQSYSDPFVIASDAAGKLVYTNTNVAQAEVTARITDPTLFDSKFVTALSWLIGAKIAPSLSGNNAKAVMDNANRMYVYHRGWAGSASMNEGVYDNSPHSEFLEARE